MTGILTRLAGPVSQTGHVIRLMGRQTAALSIFLVATVGYLGVYLYAIANLSLTPGAGVDLMVVHQPLARMVEPGPGRFIFEPIAQVDLWVIRILFSPLNTIIGLVLAILVGWNLALSYVAIRQPKACGLGTSSGFFASLPAVLAGSACCAPVVFLVLGITAGGSLLLILSWALPVGVILLILSLVYLASKVDTVSMAQRIQ